jgi:hypothetical protein
MVHTYEVCVDIREYIEQAGSITRFATARYEIDAESRQKAYDNAIGHARSDFPQSTEQDVRVTRILK